MNEESIRTVYEPVLGQLLPGDFILLITLDDVKNIFVAYYLGLKIFLMG